jgi:hypothetical protein
MPLGVVRRAGAVSSEVTMRLERRSGTSFSRVAALVLMSLATPACHDWVAVRPAEIPKLGLQNQRVVLEQPSGRFVEPDTSSHVNVVTRDGRETLFTDPVRAHRAENGDLVIQGGNRGPTRFDVGDIERTEVRRFRIAGTATAIFFASVGALLAVALTVALAFPPTATPL